ncbi:MAG: SAM-dependent methyltransferase, partial [Acidimicrobiia bacterium]
EVVALVTDAGTPTVSDPGATAVAAAVAAGAVVTVVPGPSAVTAALAVAGFDADRFVFEGFLPRKGPPRSERLDALAAERRTAVVFLSPHRAGADLADLAETLGEGRLVVVARELTKLHEEVWRGTLGEAAEHWGPGAKGELTIVVAGVDPPAADLDAAVRDALAEIEAGVRPSEAVRRAARAHGVARSVLYDLVLAGRQQ